MSDALLWNEIGSIYDRMGLLDKSIQAYQKAVEISPDSAQINCNLASVYFQKKEYRRAISLYRKSLTLISETQELSRVWSRIGDAYRMMKDLENAIQAYHRADELEMQAVETPAAKLADTIPLSVMNLETAWMQGAQEEAAPATIPPTTKEQAFPPQPASTAPQAASVMQVPTLPPGSDPSLEEILAKIKAYIQITQGNPKHHRAWDTLGKLYKSIGRYQDAITAYHRALEASPENADYYYFLGLLYAAERQDDNAILAFEEVLRINPDYVLANSALAGIFHRLGKEAKANEHISAALPKMNEESAYNRACFYAICGDAELALEFLRLAVRNNDTTLEWIRTDPDLEAIRSEKRYEQMLLEFEDPNGHPADENYFSSELAGASNHLLPLLNNAIAR